MNATNLRISTTSQFTALLRSLTGLESALSPVARSAVDALFVHIGPPPPQRADKITDNFYGKVNEKLNLNKKTISTLYSDLAKEKITLNYIQKLRVSRIVNARKISLLEEELNALKVPQPVVNTCLENMKPATREETKQAIADEARNPSKLRKALQREVEQDVFSSLAGCLTWELWESNDLYVHFGGGGQGTTVNEYLDYLKEVDPSLFARNRTSSISFINPAGEPPAVRRHTLQDWVEREWRDLANHGFLFMLVNVNSGRETESWEWISEATLVAERGIETPLKQMFFRSTEIEQETVSYIPNLDRNSARFDLLSEGFTYRDTFVLKNPQSQTVEKLLLVMQKNRRDESTLPCPDCRWSCPEGNSYPTLGVKSWECSNPLCPERSIYNRGRRYQFKSILAQASIEDEDNRIPSAVVKRWIRDVADYFSDRDTIEMVVRNYSLFGDGIAVSGASPEVVEHVRSLGRGVAVEPSLLERTHTEGCSTRTSFWDGPFFSRFIQQDPEVASTSTDQGDRPPLAVRAEYVVINDDSREYLDRQNAGIVDRAITSPPYYNAREYSSWPNLYCYLYDMYENAKAVFRSLAPGGVYIYNVFDHFDNDRTVTFSAMGKRRIPLGALSLEIMKRAGFELADVSPWDKGDIEGKRGFNSGNFSPYYQAPFNCWEHVLVLRKPGASQCAETLQREREVLKQSSATVARINPVYKIRRGGINVHGHTAPFPVEIPARYLGDLPEGSTVLDPFAGSGTTGVAALRAGHKALLVELDPTYAELCVSNLEAAVREPTMVLEALGARS